MARDDGNTERRPLAKSASEKHRPHTVKMVDSLWARFTKAALFEGQQNISTFVRDCALIGLEYRERDQVFGAHRGRTGITARAAGTPFGRTAG